jgi:hypothetical protein
MFILLKYFLIIMMTRYLTGPVAGQGRNGVVDNKKGLPRKTERIGNILYEEDPSPGL